MAYEHDQKIRTIEFGPWERNILERVAASLEKLVEQQADQQEFPGEREPILEYIKKCWGTRSLSDISTDIRNGKHLK